METLEIIVGSMFSGKTEEFIRRLKRAKIAKQKIQAFKPWLDDRYHSTDICSHDQTRFVAKIVQNAKEILTSIHEETTVVGIDEIQFFDMSIVQVVQEISKSGRRVIMAGLDTDWQGLPFGPTPFLMAISDTVTKLSAICVQCGLPATRTQRIVEQNAQILVGAKDQYEARCRKCHCVHSSHVLSKAETPYTI